MKSIRVSKSYDVQIISSIEDVDISMMDMITSRIDKGDLVGCIYKIVDGDEFDYVDVLDLDDDDEIITVISYTGSINEMIINTI